MIHKSEIVRAIKCDLGDNLVRWLKIISISNIDQCELPSASSFTHVKTNANCHHLHPNPSNRHHLESQSYVVMSEFVM